MVVLVEFFHPPGPWVGWEVAPVASALRTGTSRTPQRSIWTVVGDRVQTNPPSLEGGVAFVVTLAT